MATGGTETAAGGAVTAVGGAVAAVGGVERAPGRVGGSGPGTVPGLRLRPPRAADEAAFAAGHRAMARAGVDRVLVTCDQGNAGSRAVIEACGGVLDSVVHLDGKPPALRFWID